MEKEDFKGKWDQFKGDVQKKWGKLTDDDLDVIEGDREKLIGKLQERHNTSREEAEREADDLQRR